MNSPQRRCSSCIVKLSTNKFVVKISRLEGKVAIITGGARGIGGATAKLFAENGAHVVIADILDELGSHLAESIHGRFIHCDVSKEADVESAVMLALAWKGRLDIMFNNAGIPGPDGTISNLDMARMTHVVQVNLNGTVHGIKHAARAMIKPKNGGCIICTSSTAALMGGLASHSYTLSKEAILGVCRSAACELGVHGIRVNCISPHGVPSDMLVNAYRNYMPEVKTEEVIEMLADKGSLLHGRAGSVEDIANAALFLAEDEGGYITGHDLVVDGGYTSAFRTLIHMYEEKQKQIRPLIRVDIHS